MLESRKYAGNQERYVENQENILEIKKINWKSRKICWKLKKYAGEKMLEIKLKNAENQENMLKIKRKYTGNHETQTGIKTNIAALIMNAAYSSSLPVHTCWETVCIGRCVTSRRHTQCQYKYSFPLEVVVVKMQSCLE